MPGELYRGPPGISYISAYFLISYSHQDKLSYNFIVLFPNINIAPSEYFGQCFLYSCLGTIILISYLISFFNSSHRISTYQLRTNFRSKYIKIYRLLSFSKIPLALEISSFIGFYGDIETYIGIVNL